MRSPTSRHRLSWLWLLAACALGPSRAGAQLPMGPPGLLFPNYDRVLVGETEALEGGAFVARARGPAASWYNPAGLVLTPTTTASLSTGGWEYQLLSASQFRSSDVSQSVTARPSFVGVVLGTPVLPGDDLRIGLSITNFTAIRPSLDAQATRTVASGDETVTYATSSQLMAYRLALGAGWRLSDAWRVGASLDANYLSMQRNETVTDRLAPPGGAAPALAQQSQNVSGRGANLALSLGVQWQPTGWLSLGALVITPGLHVYGSSAVTYESQSLGLDGVTVATTLRDKHATYEYYVPVQVNLGAAVSGALGALEVDVRYHASQPAYVVSSTTAPVTVTVVRPDGSFQVTNLMPPWYTAAGRTVVNVAAGGRLAVSSAVTLHGGFFTDFSPVAPSERPLFQSVNLYGVTGGVSLQEKNFSGSVGGAYTWGRSEPLEFKGLLGGPAFLGTIDASIVSLLFAISYRA